MSRELRYFPSQDIAVSDMELRDDLYHAHQVLKKIDQMLLYAIWNMQVIVQ